MVDVNRLANICRNYPTTPTHHPPPPAYVWVIFLLIWSGWQREFSKWNNQVFETQSQNCMKCHQK